MRHQFVDFVDNQPVLRDHCLHCGDHRHSVEREDEPCSAVPIYRCDYCGNAFFVAQDARDCCNPGHFV